MLDQQIEQQRRAIKLGERVLALRASPGYEDFHKSLQDLRNYARTRLVTCYQGDSFMRVLQGQVQAYETILELMGKTEKKLEQLAANVKQLETDRDLFNRTTGGPSG